MLPLLTEIVQKQVQDVRIYLETYRRRLIENINKGGISSGLYF